MKNEQTERNKHNGVMLSVLTAVILTAVMLVSGRSMRAKEPYRLGDFSNTDSAEQEQIYLQSGSAEDLVKLLCSLCYEAEVGGDASAETKILDYGTTLYDLARSGKIALDESMPTETLSEELIRLIRKYGAR